MNNNSRVNKCSLSKIKLYELDLMFYHNISQTNMIKLFISQYKKVKLHKFE